MHFCGECSFLFSDVEEKCLDQFVRETPSAAQKGSPAQQKKAGHRGITRNQGGKKAGQKGPPSLNHVWNTQVTVRCSAKATPAYCRPDQDTGWGLHVLFASLGDVGPIGFVELTIYFLIWTPKSGVLTKEKLCKHLGFSQESPASCNTVLVKKAPLNYIHQIQR